MYNSLIKHNTRLGDILLADPRALTVMARFGIKMGVGDNTIAEVCDRLHIDTQMLVTLLNTFIHEDYYPDTNLAAISVESVIDYLRKTNAYYQHFMLPTIERHFELLLARSADKAGNLTLMRQYFDSAKRLLTDRIKHDEEVWFPAVLANKGCRIDPDDVEDRVSDLMSMFIIHLKGDYDQQLGYAVVLALAGLRDDLHQNNRIRERILSPLSTANK